ncbi:MAG: Uma2 family endonuclease [Armatimonadota bacterium]
MTVTQKKRVVHYPYSDGKPMAESPEHLQAMIYIIAALQAYFASREDVYVASNQFLYWVEGNLTQRVAADIYVAFGVPKYPLHPTWKVWEIGKAPDVIFELTSRSTAGEDLYKKYRLYQRLGVKEYFLVDVKREYLVEPIFLHRLVKGNYELIPNERPNDREWWATSELLGLRLMVRAEDTEYIVRLWDPVKQAFLPSIQEMEERYLSLYGQLLETQQWVEEQERRAQEEAQRAQEEARLRAQLEARLRELEQELRRLKEGNGKRTNS